MLNLEDPFVRRWMKVVVFIFAIAVSVPSVLGFLISVNYRMAPEGNGNPFLAAAFLLFPDPSQLKNVVGLLGIFLAALPAALIAVAFDGTGEARKLGIFGRWLAIIFGLALATGVFAYVTIHPEEWGSNHRLEEAGLQRLVALIGSSLQVVVMYLALLFGLRGVK